MSTRLADIFLVFLQAAKEAGALQDAKSKLENQLEELTSNLELEKKMRVHIMQHCLFSHENKFYFLKSL